MIPLLFDIGPIPVHSFGLMVALALVAGALRLAKSFERYGISPALAERYVMWGGISGIIGARVWFIGEHWREASADLAGYLFASAGFTFYGGFIIAALVVMLRAKLDGVSIARLADALGPTLALGYAIGRLGCQLSGDGDYGQATAGFWGMSYENGTVPTPPGVRVYPTPLFESVVCLGIALVLGRLEVRPGKVGFPGGRFAVYLFLIAAERFFIEFMRVNPEVSMGLSQAQFVSVGLCAVAGSILLARIFTVAKNGSSPAA